MIQIYGPSLDHCFYSLDWQEMSLIKFRPSYHEVEMSKRAARPGPARARWSPARFGPGPPGTIKNRAGPTKHAGSVSCPSPARNGPKRVGPARLARKKTGRKAG
jgi:hypothetical protein